MLLSVLRPTGIEMKKKDWGSTLETGCSGWKRPPFHSIGNGKLFLNRKLFYQLSIETRNIGDHLAAQK